MSRIREENRKIRSNYEELSLRFDDEVYSGSTWKKEKERLETKIQDVTKAYDASVAAQAEQQSQIVSLHSQVRELRSVLNDAETDRAGADHEDLDALLAKRGDAFDETAKQAESDLAVGAHDDVGAQLDDDAMKAGRYVRGSRCANH